MPTTTLTGGPGVTFTYTASSSAGLTVAQQIANALQAAQNASTLSVTSATGGGAIPAPGGPVSELVLTGTGGASTIPSGYNFVTNTQSGPATITASSGTGIVSSLGGGLFIESGSATRSEEHT